MPFLDFWQFLASEMELKEDPQWLRGQWATRCLCPQSPFLSLLSHQPWNWRVSLSSIRGPLSLCLELSDFNEHTCILFVEVSFYPVLKVVWETHDSLCLGTATGKHTPSWLRCLGILKAKMDFTQSKTFFFSISFKNNCFLEVYLLRTRILCLFGIWVNFWIICSYNSHFWETWI